MQVESQELTMDLDRRLAGVAPRVSSVKVLFELFALRLDKVLHVLRASGRNHILVLSLSSLTRCDPNLIWVNIKMVSRWMRRGWVCRMLPIRIAMRR